MIDFYYWPTPNGRKVAILLEELGLPYTPRPVDISKGEQFAPAFLAISPNHRIPAIVDRDVAGPPVSVFESGAIMFYLAEKSGRFMPACPRLRKEVLEWLFWQTGNQGPMAGQLSHFVNYAPPDSRPDNRYALERYRNEYDRCLGVLERRLEGRRWLVGDAYSIADMICWPWVLIARPLGATLEGFPRVQAWRQAMKERPAVRRAVDLGKEMLRSGPPGADERRLLFGQNARTASDQARRRS